jgi:ATP-dependent RNA helicase RhlE
LTQFSDLGLAEPVLRALSHEGYVSPTPIQAQAIPSLLDGKDLLGIAQTGTGKTAAFALPILDRLSKSSDKTRQKSCRVLVLAPTRELAAQIGDSFRAYGRFTKTSVAVVVGGVAPGPQIKAINPGVDVLVATPGRLLDHVDSGKLKLDQVDVVVLDEADHMLDLGFLPPIKRIIKMLPKSRQNLFFSATMPGQIGQLAGDMLRDPVKVSVTPVATTQERVDQSVYYIEATRKRQLLAELLDSPVFERTLVFTRTKRGADRVARHLEANKISASAIHGNKSQNQRERALNAFKDGQVRVLVATDIAARGIDVDGVTHVVNYELPNVPESYVHRIGRTARGGAAGAAIAFCADDERGLLKDIEKTTRQSIPSIDRRDPDAAAEQEAQRATAREERGNGGNNGVRRGGRRNANGGAAGGAGGSRGGNRPARARGGENRNPRNNRNADARNGDTVSAQSSDNNHTANADANGNGRYKGGRKKVASQDVMARRNGDASSGGGNGGTVRGNTGNRDRISSDVAFLGKPGGGSSSGRDGNSNKDAGGRGRDGGNHRKQGAGRPVRRPRNARQQPDARQDRPARRHNRSGGRSGQQTVA